ncbi:hypothetical protein TUSST3_76060 [Streptomyces sp. TUS-ST3]|jgi:hypothetical protein|nr:hypothetical protein [Streptomyces sp. TUS-ST3]GLP70986.1 hypothetical protein TUSST3_76060 [Streptomyces sp. TUS-ST3]
MRTPTHDAARSLSGALPGARTPLTHRPERTATGVPGLAQAPDPP